MVNENFNLTNIKCLKSNDQANFLMIPDYQQSATSLIDDSNRPLTILSNREKNNFSPNLNDNDHHAVIQSMLAFKPIPSNGQLLTVILKKVNMSLNNNYHLHRIQS